jgi:cell division protein FtsN
VTPQQVMPIPPVSPPTTSREAVRTVTASMQGETSLKAATTPAQSDTQQASAVSAKPSPVGSRTDEPAQVAAKNPPARPMMNVDSKPEPAAPVASEHPPAAAPPAVSDSPDMPAAGETFWQVGVVDHKLAGDYTQRLSSLGLPVRLAPGQSAEGRRVLVGPFHSGSELESARKVLTSAGYQHFLRRF